MSAEQQSAESRSANIRPDKHGLLSDPIAEVLRRLTVPMVFGMERVAGLSGHYSGALRRGAFRGLHGIGHDSYHKTGYIGIWQRPCFHFTGGSRRGE